MYGITAISHHNGWQIAILGMLIVFSGLSLLSFTISQIPKILKIWEAKDLYYQHAKEHLKKVDPKSPVKKLVIPKYPRRRKDDSLPGDMELSPYRRDFADQIELLIEHLGQPFALPKLLELTISRGLVRPHPNINHLILLELIVPDDFGYYNWDQHRYQNLIKKSSHRSHDG